MGFRHRGHGNNGHRWSNHPDRYHQVCITCGCTKEMKTINRETVYIYKDRFGNVLDGCPKCKSVYDLLNEE